MAKKPEVVESEVKDLEVEPVVVDDLPVCTCSEEARVRGDEVRKAEKVARELAQAGHSPSRKWD